MKGDRVSEDEDNVAGAKSLGFKGANYEKNKNKNRGNKRGNKIDDPQLQEFLQVMQPQVKSLLWENDSIVASTADLDSEFGKKGSQGKKEGSEKSIPAEFEIDKGDNDTDG